jgi:hypothetical protein
MGLLVSTGSPFLKTYLMIAIIIITFLFGVGVGHTWTILKVRRHEDKKENDERE